MNCLIFYALHLLFFADNPEEIQVLEKDVEDVSTAGGRRKRRAASKAIKKFVEPNSGDESDGDFKGPLVLMHVLQ